MQFHITAKKGFYYLDNIGGSEVAQIAPVDRVLLARL